MSQVPGPVPTTQRQPRDGRASGVALHHDHHLMGQRDYLGEALDCLVHFKAMSPRGQQWYLAWLLQGAQVAHWSTFLHCMFVGVLQTCVHGRAASLPPDAGNLGARLAKACLLYTSPSPRD